MATIIRDPILEQRVRAERAARGGDRYDEVWDGVYIMAPMPNDEHQMLVGRLTRILDEVIGDSGLGEVRPGVNVSNTVEDRQHNYRVPDVAVFLTGTKAVNHSSFWLGGPDFAIEITSEGDQTRDKLDFYAAVKTGELLIVDRNPWQLELYQLANGSLDLVATSRHSEPTWIVSQQTELQFRLAEQDGQRMVVRQTSSGKEWAI